MNDAIIQAVVSGIIGGVITGGVALTAIKIHIHYLRRDVDALFKIIHDMQRKP